MYQKENPSTIFREKFSNQVVQNLAKFGTSISFIFDIKY